MDARKWKGITPFCILLIALRKNPLSNKLWAFIKTIHEIFSAQTMIPWTNEIQKEVHESFTDEQKKKEWTNEIQHEGEWYEKTPFSILLHLLIIHPKSNDFYFMVKKVHESLGNDTKKTAWLKKREAGHHKGKTPFSFLHAASHNHSDSNQLSELFETVQQNLGNDANTACLNEIVNDFGATNI